MSNISTIKLIIDVSIMSKADAIDLTNMINGTDKFPGRVIQSVTRP